MRRQNYGSSATTFGGKYAMRKGARREGTMCEGPYEKAFSSLRMKSRGQHMS